MKTYAEMYAEAVEAFPVGCLARVNVGGMVFKVCAVQLDGRPLLIDERGFAAFYDCCTRVEAVEVSIGGEVVGHDLDAEIDAWADGISMLEGTHVTVRDLVRLVHERAARRRPSTLLVDAATALRLQAAAADRLAIASHGDRVAASIHTHYRDVFNLLAAQLHVGLGLDDVQAEDGGARQGAANYVALVCTKCGDRLAVPATQIEGYVVDVPAVWSAPSTEMYGCPTCHWRRGGLYPMVREVPR